MCVWVGSNHHITCLFVCLFGFYVLFGFVALYYRLPSCRDESLHALSLSPHLPLPNPPHKRNAQPTYSSVSTRTYYRWFCKGRLYWQAQIIVATVGGNGHLKRRIDTWSSPLPPVRKTGWEEKGFRHNLWSKFTCCYVAVHVIYHICYISL